MVNTIQKLVQNLESDWKSKVYIIMYIHVATGKKPRLNVEK